MVLLGAALVVVGCSDGDGGADGSAGSSGATGSTGGSGGAGAGGSGGGGAGGSTGGSGGASTGGGSGAGGAGTGGAGTGGAAGSGGSSGSSAGGASGSGGAAGSSGAGGAGGAAASCTPSPATARYRVDFVSTWSSTTHPTDFPPGPHFSGLIGATHDSTFSLWSAGATASDGIESMAETGSKTLLMGEIATGMSAGADVEISGGGINPSPGTVSVSFDVNAGSHYVSLVSMIAPSPDWFVGVDGLNLCRGDQWVASRVVDLFVYDAGTDDGVTYTSANANTNPRERIARIEAPPFEVVGTVTPIGTFEFTRL